MEGVIGPDGRSLESRLDVSSDPANSISEFGKPVGSVSDSLVFGRC